MTEAPLPNVVEFTVSELSAALKRTIEDAYGYVRVRGELGNVKYHTSGHVYLDLKDDRASISGVIWRNTATRVRIKLEAGLEVVVTGRITTYPAQSKYQIVIDTIEPAGLGALMALLEERKRKLAAEGLFDAARKKPLPYLPSIIGVITSPTGAVIRDILHRLADRFPRRVLVWPVKVQGEDSARQVAAAIRGFNALPARHPVPKPDLIIVARGGGSLEDLWSFNEEIVVRAAAESQIPLISAVGHETDFTLLDLAADRRAPTPTAAAEMAVPVRADLIAEVDDFARRLVAAWMRGMTQRRNELRAAARALPGPDDLLAAARQRLDAAAERLPRALSANAHLHHLQFSRVATRLTPSLLGIAVERRRERLAGMTLRLESALRANAHLHYLQLSRVAARLAPPLLTIALERRRERLLNVTRRLETALKSYRDTHLTRIARQRERVVGFAERAERAMKHLIAARSARTERAAQLLTAFSYRGVLGRGFALVRDMTGRPVRAATAVKAGMRLDIEFVDGRVSATAEDPRLARPAMRRSSSGSGEGGQGNLFGT